MTAQFCDQCGSPNRLQARFCWHCGQPLLPAISASSADDSLGDAVVFSRRLIHWVEAHVSNRLAKATTIAIAQAIIREGLKQLEAGAPFFQLRKGLEESSTRAAHRITMASRPITSREEIAQVVTTMVEDQQVSVLLSEVMDRVGQDGTIYVEVGEAAKTQTQVAYVAGIRLEQGYLSPYFVTDAERAEAVMSNPFILITDQKISEVPDILPILEQIMQQGRRDLVIIAGDVSGEALATLVINKQRGTLNVLAVGISDLHERSPEMLGDIAIVTGGQVISQTQGRRLAQARLDDLGSARQVIAHEHGTLIVDARGESSALQRRMRQITTMMEKTATNYEREALRKRLATLAGGVAVIQVGGSTETGLLEQRQHFEDGLCAIRAALEEGVVAGGGAGLLMAVPALDEMLAESPEMQVGVQVVRRALEEPLHRNARKVGRKGEEVVTDLSRLPGYGIDLQTGAYVNMFVVGCIEPVRLVRLAILRAVEIALEFFELNAQDE